MAGGPLDALILAAGRGTRLGPIGEATPKALLEVGGRTMLEHVVARLLPAGVDRLIVNVHHHADAIEDFIASHELGAEVVLSRESERPLETGGALLHARDLVRRDSPFFVHNVDVICEVDLASLLEGHRGTGAIATMAVNDRSTQRHLLFDDHGLFGRSDARRDLRIEVREPVGPVAMWAFAGIHVVEPRLLDRITERGAFPILDTYLRLAKEKEKIRPGPIGEVRWLEVGNPERLAAARAAMAATGDRS